MEKAAGLPVIVDADDVWVTEPGEQLRFTLKAPREGGIDSQRLREQLERCKAIEFLLAHFEYPAHPALADKFNYFKLRKGGLHNLNRGRRLAGGLVCSRFHGRQHQAAWTAAPRVGIQESAAGRTNEGR